MRLAVLGPPGSEREQVADALAARLGVPVVSLAGIVQAEVRADSPAATQALRHMRVGELVPEHVLLGMIRSRLSQPDVAPGFVLDGLPNRSVQGATLDAVLSDLGVAVDGVIDLVLADAEVLRRLAGRRTCRRCGRLWHTEFAAPTRPGACDGCGGELFRRDDDSPERITTGLGSYRPASAVVLDHYRALGKLVSVDATLTPAEITAKVLP
ncbi:nucleoside monophosphate kinase [Micromonospora sp. WMMD1102]|uniref:adenylate kinase family protein n=1 Tax=Micromonospora sp. WMMD1102 TaxID=3016105 RepID=UPI0024152064|nr:nucleoside monophosphate kinase [Micromonospora sp. WMMD1102]MDG4786870.1 nucleoside monophosphate kinase [Micromonospora sp. WMMD1102]